MTNIIKLGSLPISAFKVGNANCKIYLADTLLYPHSHVQEPCFAVVDDITQYQDRTYADVFNEADNKWYKLNNLNEYEEYGLYGNGRTECTSGTPTLPSGYTEVEYIERTSAYNGYIPLGETFGENTVIEIDFQMTQSDGGVVIGDYGTNDRNDWRVFVNYRGIVNNFLCYDFDTTRQTYNTGDWSQRFHLQIGNYFIKDADTGTYLINSTAKTSFTRPNQMYLFHMEGTQVTTVTDYGKIYSVKIYQNNTLVKDFVPCGDGNGNFGLYDNVSSSITQPIGSFTGGTPITSDCVTTYEGKLTIDGNYEYIYSGGSWVNVGEVSGGTALLPNKSFVLNYNAKNYNATTHSIPYTSGQTKQVDAVQNYGSNTIVDHSSDGYISVTANTRLTVSGGTTSLSRTNTQTGCSMTIVSKARTSEFYSIVTNRGSYSDMNWMWRYPANGIFLHGSSSYNKVTYYTVTSASPITASVRVSWNGSVQQQINDWTNNGSYSGAFQYGSTSNSGALFCDYLREKAEFWKGDFYWVYLSQEVLTDEEIQQVIAYNEGSGEPTYPMYYDEKADPLDNVTFTSMTEAESYECPWVGMHATIAGDKYIFSGDSQSGYEWVEVTLPYDAQVEYLESSGSQYINTGVYLNKSSFEVGYVLDGYPSGAQWGYVHQNVANGAWVTVENNLAFMGRFSTNGSYDLKISAYTSSTQNTIIYNNSGVQVNGTTLTKSLSLTTTDNIETIPLHFFARYDFYKKGLEYGSCKFKSFYVKNNNELVVDMIPVRVGQVGYMYDRVSGQLFSNAGTGQFILGPDV